MGLNKGGGGEFGEAVGGAGTGVTYNPRRRVVTKGGMSERDEYYVSRANCGLLGRELWIYANEWCLRRNLWPKIWIIGSRKEWKDGRGNRTGDYDVVSLAGSDREKETMEETVEGCEAEIRTSTPTVEPDGQRAKA